MGKRVISLLLAVVMVIGMVPLSPLTTFAAETKTVEAFVAPGAVTVDADLDESLWAFPNKLDYVTGTGVSGFAYMAWSKGILHLAVEYTGATALTVALGSKTWEIDLTAASIPATDGVIAGKNANGIIELELDMLKAGADVGAFGQTADFQVKLTGATGTAALAEEQAKLAFTGKETARFTLSGGKNVTVSSDKRMVTFKQSGATRSYLQLGTTMLDHSKDIYVEKTITINQLDNATGNLGSGHNASGYAFWIVQKQRSASAPSTSSGPGTLACIFNDNGVLTLRVHSASGSSFYPLGVDFNRRHYIICIMSYLCS